MSLLIDRPETRNEHSVDDPERAGASEALSPSRSALHRVGLRIGAVVATIVAGLAVAAYVLPAVFSAFGPHVYNATVLQGSHPAPSMNDLRLASGDAVDLGAYAGDVVLVYFGYVACPDVCPTTLAMTALALDELDPEQREAVRLLMVSIDPERDTPRIVDEYASFFDPSFFGASGDAVAVEHVATQYGIFYRSNEADEDGHYFVDHTSALMAIDRDGVLRLVWPPDATADEVAADLEELVG